MAIQVILNQQAGPLPINANFNAPSDAPIYLIVTGSVWSQTADTFIGIAIQLDGQAIGTAQIWSNATYTHRTVVPTYIQIQLQQGQHTLTLSPAPNTPTIGDQYDLYTAVLDY